MIDWLFNIFSFLDLVTRLALGAMSLSESAFQLAANKPALGAALFIAFLSGISEMTGQSIILVFNRVPLYRFIASLLFTGLIYLVSSITWAASVLMVAPMFGATIQDSIGYAGLFAIIALSYAPRLLGIFSIAPYFGLALGIILDTWTMVCVIFGLNACALMPFEAAALCGVIGWATALVFRTILGGLLRKPLAKIRHMISGSALERTPRELIDHAIDQLNPKNLSS